MKNILVLILSAALLSAPVFAFAGENSCCCGKNCVCKNGCCLKDKCRCADCKSCPQCKCAKK